MPRYEVTGGEAHNCVIGFHILRQSAFLGIATQSWGLILDNCLYHFKQSLDVIGANVRISRIQPALSRFGMAIIS